MTATSTKGEYRCTFCVSLVDAGHMLSAMSFGLVSQAVGIFSNATLVPSVNSLCQLTGYRNIAQFNLTKQKRVSSIVNHSISAVVCYRQCIKPWFMALITILYY